MELFGLGAPELLLIVFVLLLFFGKDKLPDLARSIGRSRHFTIQGGREEGRTYEQKILDAE
jgi:TatA/E family protein of Tat protein translocase